MFFSATSDTMLGPYAISTVLPRTLTSHQPFYFPALSPAASPASRRTTPDGQGNAVLMGYGPNMEWQNSGNPGISEFRN